MLNLLRHYSTFLYKSIRRADILAVNWKTNSGYIINPTIRFKIKKSQPQDVNENKKYDATK